MDNLGRGQKQGTHLEGDILGFMKRSGRLVSGERITEKQGKKQGSEDDGLENGKCGGEDDSVA